MQAERVEPGTGGARFRALVVDDEPPLVQVVSGYLTREGFDVTTAGDGNAAVKSARDTEPDVIVLDLMLPGIDGVEVCRRIRTFSDAYIIMLTAKSDEVDKLVGLSVGADDYLTKPFSPRELVARVRAMLRRPRTAVAAPQPKTRRFGDLEIDVAGREVRVRGRVVELTRTEFDLLDALSAQPRVAFSRRQLLDHVWGGDWYGDDHVIDVHVGNLRRKLDDDAAHPRYIRTVRGVGYRMGPG
ncbi:response regulator [Micromonospora sp. MS34]|uniref:response regulator n=1 Tax=Micromonospora sp. MS34 TaxID=3385971 RepID=UPI00399FE17D